MRHGLRCKGLALKACEIGALMLLLTGILPCCRVASLPPEEPELSFAILYTMGLLFERCENPDKLAYSSNESGYHAIMTMKSDGSELTQITHNTVEDVNPSWSPDGTQIVFQSNRLGVNGLYLIDSEGQQESVLLEDGTQNYEPVFSLDGQGVYFSSPKPGPQVTLFYIDIATQALTQITPSVTGTNDRDPALSRATRQLYFTRNLSGVATIARADLDGNNPSVVLNGGMSDTAPSVARDGSFLVYQTNVAGSYQINRMGLNAEDPVYLSGASLIIEDNPAVSPDGAHIAFESTRQGGQQQIFVMNPDGTNQVGLHNNNTSVTNLAPSWSCP